MPDTYPVVKIPDLIANVKPQQIEHRSIVEQVTGIVKYPKFVIRSEQIGYGLLFLSMVIFAVAAARDVRLLPYSVISLCLGIAAINTASLLKPTQRIYTHRSSPAIPGEGLHQQQNVIDKVETLPVDWQKLLDGKVMPFGKTANTQVGVSEWHFKNYLTKYFASILRPSYEFKIDDNYRYSSDFTLILPNGISLIIEVDEPYNGKDNKPHHCTDIDRDDNRDNFFLNGNWIVIRFSEFQVCAYPTECCYVIARTIYSFDPSSSSIRAFKGVSDLPIDRRWNTRQATQMAQQNYRLGYLNKYKVFPNPNSIKHPYKGLKSTQPVRTISPNKNN